MKAEVLRHSANLIISATLLMAWWLAETWWHYVVLGVMVIATAVLNFLDGIARGTASEKRSTP